MKTLETLFLALFVLAGTFWIVKSADHQAMADLLKENQQLRDWNTRRDRRLHWMEAPKNIDKEAIALGFHIEAVPPSLIAALLYTENGPPLIETGSLDKSDFIARIVPLKFWSTIDGARTLNRLHWDWQFQTPEGRASMKSFFLYAAKPYTSLSKREQECWAKNMIAAHALFDKQIKLDPQAPLIQPIRTPTEIP